MGFDYRCSGGVCEGYPDFQRPERRALVGRVGGGSGNVTRSNQELRAAQDLVQKCALGGW